MDNVWFYIEAQHFSPHKLHNHVNHLMVPYTSQTSNKWLLKM